MTTTPFTDRQSEPAEVFDALLARLEAAPVCDEDTVERVARAMWHADYIEFGGWDPGADETESEWQEMAPAYRRQARAALAAMKAPGTDTADQQVQHDEREGQAREAVARWLCAAVDGPTQWDDSQGWKGGAAYRGGFLVQADELISTYRAAAGHDQQVQRVLALADELDAEMEARGFRLDRIVLPGDRIRAAVAGPRRDDTGAPA